MGEVAQFPLYCMFNIWAVVSPDTNGCQPEPLFTFTGRRNVTHATFATILVYLFYHLPLLLKEVSEEADIPVVRFEQLDELFGVGEL